LYKNELIQLHQFLLYLCKFFEDNGASKSYFEEYLKTGIASHHIHKTKAEHKYAIFVLARCMTSILAEHQENVPRGIVAKMEEIAQRYKSDAT
jgi:hypothetical protein